MIQRRGGLFMIEAVAIPAGPAIHIVFDAPLSKKEWKGAGSAEWCLRIEDESVVWFQILYIFTPTRGGDDPV